MAGISHTHEIVLHSAQGSYPVQGYLRVYESLSYTKRYQAVGSWTLALGEESPLIPYLLPGMTFIEVRRDGVTDFWGFLDALDRTWDEASPKTPWQASGSDLAGWVLRSRVAVPPTGAQYYGVGPSAAETAMRQMMLDHFIDPQDTARVFANLVLGAAHTPALGSISVILNLHGEKFSDTMNKVALAAGVGFRVIVNTANQLQFEVYTGTDRSVGNASGAPPAIFDPKFNNLRAMTFKRTLADLENHLYVGGGDGNAFGRFSQEVESTPSLNTWGRFEAYFDGLSAVTTTIAILEGEAYLATKAQVDTVNFTPRETAQLQYVRDWNLGDSVTVQRSSWGLMQALPIVEVKLTLDRSGQERIDVQTNLLSADYMRRLKQQMAGVMAVRGNPHLPVRPDGRYALTLMAADPTNPAAAAGDLFLDSNTGTGRLNNGTSWGWLNSSFFTQLPNLTADPASPVAGQSYFNSSTGAVRIWNGSAWKTVTVT